MEDRMDLLSHNFFKCILPSTSCLHNLLPPPRDPELLSRLRAASKYPRILNRTKKHVIYLLCSSLPVVIISLYIIYMYVEFDILFLL